MGLKNCVWEAGKLYIQSTDFICEPGISFWAFVRWIYDSNGSCQIIACDPEYIKMILSRPNLFISRKDQRSGTLCTLC